MEKLKIWMLPTLALIRQEKTVDYVVGFDDMGGKDDFSTEVTTQISMSQTISPSREGPTASCVSDDKACSQSGHRALKSVLLRASMRVLSVLRVYALLGCSCHTHSFDFSCNALACLAAAAGSVIGLCRCWRTDWQLQGSCTPRMQAMGGRQLQRRPGISEGRSIPGEETVMRTLTLTECLLTIRSGQVQS